MAISYIAGNEVIRVALHFNRVRREGIPIAAAGIPLAISFEAV